MENERKLWIIYQGKKLAPGLEIVALTEDRWDPSAEYLELGRRFGHKPDSGVRTGLTATVLAKGKTYKADMRWTPDAGYEFMVFKSNANGCATSGKDMYCRSNCQGVSLKSFLWYLMDFFKEVKK